MFSSPKVVACDCGRSSMKYTGGGSLNSFKSIHAIVELDRVLSYPSLTDYKPTVVMWKDQTYAVGDFAAKLGKSPPVMEDQLFMEYSVLLYLTAIAREVSDGESVILGTNLTFNSFRYKEVLRKLLIGTHTIGIYDFGKGGWIKKSFTIQKVGVVYQGWSALVGIALGKDKSLKQEYAYLSEKEGVVIDIGRRTADVIIIKGMTPVNGASYDYGTFNVYSAVAEILRRDFSIQKPIYDIEDRHIRGVGYNLSSGKETIDVASIVREEATKFSKDMVLSLHEYLYQETPDFVFLVGGGSYMFSPLMKEFFPTHKIFDKSEFLNVMGMYTFFS